MVARSLSILLLVLTVFIACAAETAYEFRAGTLSLPLEARVVSVDETTRRYHFRIGETLAPRGADFAVVLGVSGGFGSIELALGRDSVVQQSDLLYPVPGTSEHRYLVPVASDAKFDSLTVTVVAGDDNFAIHETGLDERSYGVSFEHSAEIDAGVRFDSKQYQDTKRYTVDFARIVDDHFGARISGVAIHYRYPTMTDSHQPEAPVVIEAFDASGRTFSYRLRPRTGRNAVYLYHAVIGFLPSGVRIESADPGFSLESAFPTWSTADTLRPIPADFTAIVDYSREAWRQEEFELFSWNLYPSILVFDTKDYDVQSRLFTRLAFFVEKHGFAGRVLSDTELEGRHGWNAHDYRAADLASFFSVSRDANLNELEIELREILLREGVIIERGGGFAAGAGGVLSISRQSTRRLRLLFMDHEGYHGMFFVDEEYRGVVFDVWRELDERERAFWRRFLQTRTYNPADEYLIVNEFQAFLLQQPLGEVDAYYIGFIVPRFKTEAPDYADFTTDLLRDLPDTFTRTAAKLLEESRKRLSVDITSFFCLEPIRR